MTRLRTTTLVALAAIAMLLSARVEAGTVGPALQAELARLGPAGEVDVIVRFAEQVDVKTFRDKDRKLRRTKLIRALMAKADADQRQAQQLLRRFGAKRLRTLWLINGTSARVPVQLVDALANLPGVDSVILDREVNLVSVPASCGFSPSGWNLDTVRAPELWSLGENYQGKNVVVATLDSGVDDQHPDLKEQYRGGGNSWFDPNGQHTDPYDSDGHGTSTMSLLVGRDQGGTAIGMAPQAKWIAVKIFDDSGVGSLSGIHAGYQWLLDPDGDPATDDAPDIVNNSWVLNGTVDQCDTEFQADIAALKATDIAVVFAAGNSGPSLSTSMSPSNDPQSLAVGSVAEWSGILFMSGTSARGPSACDGSVYPQVAAPGADVATADLTYGGIFPDSYRCVSGTSFAAPHVSGAMAILKSAMADQGVPVSVSLLETALLESAIDMGDPGPDDEWGAGLLDVVAAYNWLLANAGSPQPGELRFSVADYSTDENVGSVVVTVNRVGGSAGIVTVDYATADGTAVAGEDYQFTSGTLTFLDGETSQTFTVTIYNDATFEGDEDFSVSLGIPTGGASLGLPADATVTILDDDALPHPGQLQLSASAYSVAENGAGIAVTVNRSGGSNGDVTVDYATADGTAVAGEDYESASGTLTFLDGETSQTFVVNILDDTADEADEGFTVMLSNATGGATLASPSSATVTVLDDDPPAGPADADGDGYTEDVDCNDSDASTYPGAPEIKHDGIDQDCNGYDLTIDVTRSWYQVRRDQLVVWAISDLGSQAGLQATAVMASGNTITFNMTWTASKSRWQLERKDFVRDYGSRPISVTVTGVEGLQSAPIVEKR